MTETSPSILAEVERLLPCVNPEYPDGCFGNNGGVHWKDCPVNFRPAVAAALQARDERIKVLEAALKPFAREAEHWNDIRDQSAPTYPLKGASRLNVQMLRDARTALNPGEQKDKAE